MRGQVWQARALWRPERHEWWVYFWGCCAPDWSRGHVGIAPTRAVAIAALEQQLGES